MHLIKTDQLEQAAQDHVHMTFESLTYFANIAI